MFPKNKFEKIEINTTGVVLFFNKLSKREISFEELDRVYFKSIKIELLYEFLLIAVCLCLMLSSLFYLPLDYVQFIPIIIIAIVVVKVSSYKKYKLFLMLKNGQTLYISIPKKLKYSMLDVFHAVEKKIYECKINNADTIFNLRK